MNLRRSIAGMLVCSCLSPMVLSGAGTVVGPGAVRGVWTGSGSPYRLTGEVQIPPGAHLVIEAGVHVLGSPGSSLTIRGILAARGTARAPVIFTASDTLAGWHGLHFASAAEDSRLVHCIISYGTTATAESEADAAARPGDAASRRSNCGGGVFCWYSRPAFEYCIFRRNLAFGGGGGLYSAGPGPLLLRGCTFEENRSIHWGGGGVYLAEARTRIEGCSFTGNVAAKWTGGGIYAISSRLHIDSALFRGNSAYGGGGVFFFIDSSVIRAGTFTDNSARYGGGIECNENAVTVIRECRLSGNTADFGGGIAVVEYSNILVEACTVSGNTARKAGGGIMAAETGRPRFVRSAITGNTSEGTGGGMMCLDVEPVLEHLVIARNSASAGGGGISLHYANASFRRVSITGNAALTGGGLFLKNCPSVAFSRDDRSSVHSNVARQIGGDFFYDGGPALELPLDTFTVRRPTDVHAYPRSRLRLSHRFTAITQEAADLYVSPDGDDANRGRSASAALRTITMALTKILADSAHPRRIHLTDGTYPAEILASNYIAAGLRHISFTSGWLADLQVGPSGITVSTPLWKSGWALGTYALLLAALVLAGYQAHVRRLRIAHSLALEHVKAEHLAEADRMKSRFFANISHEFRTPLTLIIGPAELGARQAATDDQRKRFELIRRNAEKLHLMVNQILDFSRLEAGDVRLAVSRGDLAALVNRTVRAFQSWAERRRITLTVAGENEPLAGWFDGEKLEKILNNLVSNALKYTPEGGTITVTLRASAGNGEIEVTDTGLGIAPEHLPRLFDRFFRVDDSHRTEGTGIGLALTRELVDLHHGRITVRSEPGKGSTFTIAVPLEEGAYTPDERGAPAVGALPPAVPHGSAYLPVSATSERPAPGGRQPLILIVEDNTDMRTHIREHLARGYVIAEAVNGRDALEFACERVPDLVVSDVMMPEMDGFELTKALRRDRRTSHIPIILLTARAGSESRIEGLEKGADDYLTKPFDVQELRVRVRNLLEIRRKLREKFGRGVELKPGEVAVTSLDDEFLRRVMAAVERNMRREGFNVEHLALEVFLSRMQVYRKLEALTGLTPSAFIRRMRLQRARDLLEKNWGTVAEVADAVGFANHSHFTRCFRELFGILPGDVRRAGVPRSS